MTAQILTFPSKAKPRPVLRVPTINRVIKLWAELNAAIAWRDKCPTPEADATVARVRARYIRVCQDENYPA